MSLDRFLNSAPAFVASRITMLTDEFDFELPAELIAQTPLEERSSSRLLHYRRDGRSIAHRQFDHLPRLLREGDLLVLNDARVLPARLSFRKPTGGHVGGLFVRELSRGRWQVMLSNVGSYRGQLHVESATGLLAGIVKQEEPGVFEIELSTEEPASSLLPRIGRMPLPPYIRRSKSSDARDDLDRERYQTVFGRHAGAVAAPTAALHFTDELMQILSRQGVQRCFVTLHVGMGTFKSVSVERFEDHPMHAESYTISPEAAEAMNSAKREHRRIIAVGTTSARVLESQPDDAPIASRSDSTSIFIHPPYRWRHVDALITNFHMPRTTLLGLVAALVGLDEQRRIYQTAIAERYRFFSYGDAMLVE